MGSKRRISYQWKMFFPLVGALWLVFIGLAGWQYYADRENRKSQISNQLSLINNRIIAAYEQNTDIIPFLTFVCKYYRENPVYDLLRISVYKDGQLIKCFGEPIALSDSETAMEEGITRNIFANDTPDDDSSDKYFFYKASVSDDGRLSVYTVLPFDNNVMTAVLPSLKFLWIFGLVAVAMTLFAFFSSKYFGRNIQILRNVAESAATDINFIPKQDYPHDELGDISRQIIHMYNERLEAMQRERQEHVVAMHAIEEKARSKRELTNNINHELRTPIGVIKGYVDTILENPDMDEGSRTHFLKKTQEHVNRLVNLIADVSAITRLEEGGELISTEPLDYHDIAYTIANDIRESGVLGKMEFRFNVPLDCKVKGNFNLLSGMLLNLAKNAGSYSKGTFCELSMVKEDDKYYYFEFFDDGVGVGEEFLPHLFERFFRIDSGRSRKAGGTGLGLPIVQNTVKAHGGTISVYNKPEGGLCFAYSLPKYINPKNS